MRERSGGQRARARSARGGRATLGARTQGPIRAQPAESHCAPADKKRRAIARHRSPCIAGGEAEIAGRGSPPAGIRGAGVPAARRNVGGRPTEDTPQGWPKEGAGHEHID